ncbi:MAG TPA: DUF3078 domain-containing protein [Flavisolibacter sp.]
MKIKLTLLLATLTLSATAQDETIKSLKTESEKSIKKEEDTLARTWRTGGLYNLNVSQGSLRNWAAGGDEFSLSLNSLLNLQAFYKKNRNSWDNTLAVQVGYLRSSSLGSRKNDDLLDLLSKYGYSVSTNWNVGALFNFRSQMLKGYTYEDDKETFSSSFLSPAYVLLSAGMDYKPNQEFSLFLSPATARWVIVKHDSLAARGLYGVDSGSHSRMEFGAFLSANYIKEISPVVSYKGRLDLFSNYRHNPEKVDLFFSNLFAVKLTKLFSITWNVDMIYDDDVRLFGDDGKSPALQLKSLVGIGFLFKF